ASTACGAIFPIGATNFRPGAEETRGVLIANRGGAAPTFGLYVANFVARSPQSAATCVAPDPADRITLRIVVGDIVVYPRGGDAGTLAEFAARHGHVSSPLWAPATPQWQTDQSAIVTIRVGLDRTADNRYQGCVTTADLWWVAP
ncbi:MAG: hypothetical protein NZ518_11425, partial [Dehalococcoidia bacterium]|nr:hypothetical protein [Dehalococcoidia bacterium]